MTTIAFDGRFVAADTQASASGMRSLLRSEKIVAVDGAVYGAVGLDGTKDAWIQWLKDGAKPDATPPIGYGDKDVGNFLVFKDGRCWMYSWLVPYAVEEGAPCAFGSGREFALGAMLAGADARRAVEIAAQLDIHSGGPVQVIDLHALKVTEIAA